MSRRAMRPYTGPTTIRRAVSLKLPPNVQRFCRNVARCVMSAIEPYCAALTVITTAQDLGLL